MIRPLVAAGVMAGTVRGLLPAYDPSMSMRLAILMLIGGIVLGVVVYSSTLTLLWLLAGCPDSAERSVFGHVQRTVSALPRVR